MDYDAYPALFKASDIAANGFQRKYLILIRCEYLLLVLASFISMRIFEGKVDYLLFAAIFFLATAALLTRTLSKPEQDWYRCRALAESVKTMTWRYISRSEPFQDDENLPHPQNRFRTHLEELFNHSRSIAEKVDTGWSADEQITAEMNSLRSQDLPTRIGFYSAMRIGEQQNWYARKARWNKRRSISWSVAVVGAYILAAGLSLARIGFPEWPHWPIDPIIVIASSLIGWMQIKKFSELSIAYKVTAMEIGLIVPKLNGITDDTGFSEFVSEAESAFSREHTMWIARQTS